MSGAEHVGALERKVQALLEGFRREFPASAETVRFGGRPMTWGAVHALLQGMQEAFDAVHRTERAYRQAVAERRQAMKEHRSTYEDAVFFLKHHLGKESPRLALFGVALPKARRALTVEATAISRAKAAATRKARGTLGKRQRLALGRPREPILQVFGPSGQPLGAKGDAPPESKEPDPTGQE